MLSLFLFSGKGGAGREPPRGVKNAARFREWRSENRKVHLGETALHLAFKLPTLGDGVRAIACLSPQARVPFFLYLSFTVSVRGYLFRLCPVSFLTKEARKTYLSSPNLNRQTLRNGII